MPRFISLCPEVLPGFFLPSYRPFSTLLNQPEGALSKTLLHLVQEDCSTSKWGQENLERLQKWGTGQINNSFHDSGLGGHSPTHPLRLWLQPQGARLLSWWQHAKQQPRVPSLNLAVRIEREEIIGIHTLSIRLNQLKKYVLPGFVHGTKWLDRGAFTSVDGMGEMWKKLGSFGFLLRNLQFLCTYKNPVFSWVGQRVFHFWNTEGITHDHENTQRWDSPRLPEDGRRKKREDLAVHPSKMPRCRGTISVMGRCQGFESQEHRGKKPRMLQQTLRRPEGEPSREEGRIPSSMATNYQTGNKDPSDGQASSKDRLAGGSTSLTPWYH